VAIEAAQCYHTSRIYRISPFSFFFQAEDGIRDIGVTGVQTCALPILQKFKAKLGGSDEPSSGALRVTSVLRPESGSWRIVHRHADPIMSPRTAQSVI